MVSPPPTFLVERRMPCSTPWLFITTFILLSVLKEPPNGYWGGRELQINQGFKRRVYIQRTFNWANPINPAL